MADRRREPYDIYGTAATAGDLDDLRRITAGLREDPGTAEGRIRELDADTTAVIAEIR